MTHPWQILRHFIILSALTKLPVVFYRGFTTIKPKFTGPFNLKNWYSIKKFKMMKKILFSASFFPKPLFHYFSDYLLNRKWIVKIYSNKANIQSDAIVTQFTLQWCHFILLIQFKPNSNDIFKWSQSNIKSEWKNKVWSIWIFRYKSGQKYQPIRAGNPFM